MLWNFGIGCGVLGLYGFLAVQYRRWSAVGAVIAGVGVALSNLGTVISGVGKVLAVGIVLQQLELEYMLAVIGFFAILLESITLGILSVRDDSIPRWMDGNLIRGSILALELEDTTIRLLLFLPYALSWVAIGYELWTISR